MKKIEKHQFSFYYPDLPSGLKNLTFVITDPLLIHRLITVLHYEVGDTFVLFNNESHADSTIAKVSKKQIDIISTQKNFNKKIEPELVLFLPVLKKEALEQSVYNAVVAGVTKIQLLITDKCHRKSLTIVERQRLEKIIIAACEQSKYYSVPSLLDPLPLADACSRYKQYRLYYADFDGKALARLSDKSVIMVGPEGDLTLEEKKYMHQQGAYFFLLTPTVLRSQEAVLVAIAHARIL